MRLIRSIQVQVLHQIQKVDVKNYDWFKVKDLCIVVDGKEETNKFVLWILPAEKLLCPRCRRHTAELNDKPCSG